MLEVNTAAILKIVEACYASDADWPARILGYVRALFDANLTVASFEFQSSSVRDGIRFDSIERSRSLGGDVDIEEAIRQHLLLPPPIVAALFRRTGASTTSAQTGLGDTIPRFPPWRRMWQMPVVDALGLVARDPSGSGMCVCVGLRETTSLTSRRAALLTKVAVHLGAGSRLRRAKNLGFPDDAEAILTPNGNVLHANEFAKNKRDLLDEGRRQRNEARNTTHDPEKALEIWRGLTAGRWSLVDHFDTDGKRFLLAMKNIPTVDKRADLTPRERRVCALAAMGHRDKEIAYMLGLSSASVTASLHRARVKLGVKSRVELARIWTRR